MPGGRRGLVAPQNTFLENIIRRSNSQRKFQFIKLNIEYYVNKNVDFYPINQVTRPSIMTKNKKFPPLRSFHAVNYLIVLETGIE
jgi:hypothetical protein